MMHRIGLALAAAWCLVASLSADAADKKVVRIWQTESEPQSLVVLDQIAANFQKLRPDVEIKIEGLVLRFTISVQVTRAGEPMDW